MRDYASLIKQSSIHQMVWFVAAVIFVMMLYFGIAFPQQPFSDFKIHWDQSQNLDLYIKGGLSTLVYKLVSVFTVTHWKTALFINLVSWITFVYAILPKERSRVADKTNDWLHKVGFTACLFFFGVWWVAKASTVALFPMHLAFFALGINRASVEGKRSRAFWAITLILLAFSFSMRIQTVLAALIGVVLIWSLFIALPFVFKKELSFKSIGLNLTGNRKGFVLIIASSLILGIFAELVLRKNSNNTIEIETSQRAQIYNGVFKPFSGHCGGWSQSNWDLARQERGETIIDLAKKYLPQNSPDFYLNAAFCKYTRLLKTNFYVWWVPKMDNSPSNSVIENFNYFKLYIAAQNLLLKLGIFFLIVFLWKTRFRSFSLGSLFMTAVIIGMVLIIGILEFNPRYTFLIIGYLFICLGLNYQADNKSVNFKI